MVCNLKRLKVRTTAMLWRLLIWTSKLQKNVISSVELTIERSLWHNVIGCCLLDLSMMECTCHIQTSLKCWTTTGKSTLNSMFRPKFQGQNLQNLDSLNMDDKLLHYAYVHIPISQSTNFSKLLHEDIFMLWTIKNNIFINWLRQIIQHMLKCRDNNMELSYALLVAQILPTTWIYSLRHLCTWAGQIILLKLHKLNILKWMMCNNVVWWQMTKNHHNWMTIFTTHTSMYCTRPPVLSWWLNVLTNFDWYSRLGATIFNNFRQICTINYLIYI